MLFTIVTILSLAATFLGLAFHRFWTSREEAKSTILYAEIIKKFFAWLALRTVQMSRRASPRAWWGYVKGLPLWREPVLEKWLYVCFYGSFLYLAASGFFFAIFIPRGLFGYPLVGHVMAGALFAVCLTIIVLFKGRDFISVPNPASLSLALLDIRKMGITPARVKALGLLALRRGRIPADSVRSAPHVAAPAHRGPEAHVRASIAPARSSRPWPRSSSPASSSSRPVGRLRPDRIGS